MDSLVGALNGFDQEMKKETEGALGLQTLGRRAATRWLLVAVISSLM